MKLHQVELSAHMLSLMNVTNHSNNLFGKITNKKKNIQYTLHKWLIPL